MRKHIDYFYKCYDKKDTNEMERIVNERFNEYGYNFDSNSKKNIDYDALASKTNYTNCKKKISENKE